MLRLFAAEPVYVVVTVSVTPVGNVVILGVPVLSRDAVTVFETVVLEHLDPVGDGLEDLDRVDCAVALWLTDKRPVVVCLSLDVTVLESAGVEEALVLALKDAEPDAVFVVDMDAVAVLDWTEEVEGLEDTVSAVVELATDVRLGAPEGVRVSIVDAVSVWDPVGLAVFFREAEAVLEMGGVLEIGAVLVSVAVVDGEGESAGVAVVVFVIAGDPVAFGSFVELVDVVDVLETLMDLVPERVLTMDTVFCVVPVVVRLCVVLLVVDVVAVGDRDCVVERVPDADPVDDLEARVEDVGVIVGGAEGERPGVLVKDGDDEDVLELVIVLETDALDDDVFEERMDVDGEGVAEVVLELLTEGVPVLDAVVVLVLVVLLVAVLEGAGVSVGMDVELAVLETVAVRVAVVVLYAVIVCLALSVISHVCMAVFVPVVVRVDVLDCVGDCEGAIAALLAEPVNNRLNIRNRRRRPIHPYNIGGRLLLRPAEIISNSRI